MKYRKKPIIVDAEQWFLGKSIPGVKFYRALDEFGLPIPSFHQPEPYVVTINDQKVWLSPGDWVVAEPDGVHHYVCKPDVFAATYELAGEDHESA